MLQGQRREVDEQHDLGGQGREHLLLEVELSARLLGQRVRHCVAIAGLHPRPPPLPSRGGSGRSTPRPRSET